MMDVLAQMEEMGEAPEPELPRTKDIEIDVTFQKKRFTVLHLQEPKGKHVEKAEAELGVQSTPLHFRRYQTTLIAAVAGVPREVILELPTHVIEEAFDFLRDISPGGSLAAGESSPPT